MLVVMEGAGLKFRLSSISSMPSTMAAHDLLSVPYTSAFDCCAKASGIGAIISSHRIGRGTGVQRSDSFLSSLRNLTLGSR